MRTTIFIPDDLGERAYALARKKGLNRSQAHQKALAKWVEEEESSDITARINAVIAQVGQEPALMGPVYAAIEDGRWEW